MYNNDIFHLGKDTKYFQMIVNDTFFTKREAFECFEQVVIGNLKTYAF